MIEIDEARVLRVTSAATYRVAQLAARVEAWSTVRLPFEPSGESLAFRSAIRAALISLPRRPGMALHAVYTSPGVAQVDVENVLVYNVGTSAFSGLASDGLSLEHVIGDVPLPRLGPTSAAHHHLYELIGLADKWTHWTVSSPLAQYGPTEVGPLSELTPLAVIWSRIRRGTVVPFRQASAEGVLALDITVDVPLGARTSLAKIVKPVVDGVVSAFHVHVGPDTDHLAKTVAHQLGEPETAIATLLTSEEHAILGPRRLLWPRASGVQWNPADDRLRAIRLTRRTVQPHGAWSLSGRLSELAARTG